jgi:hypothetical protein
LPRRKVARLADERLETFEHTRRVERGFLAHAACDADELARVDSFPLVALLVVCCGGKFARSSFQLDALPNVRAKIRLDARASSNASGNAYSPAPDLPERFDGATCNATESSDVVFARAFSAASCELVGSFALALLCREVTILDPCDVAFCGFAPTCSLALFRLDLALLATFGRNDLIGRSFGLSNDGPIRTLPRLACAFAATANGRPKPIHLGLDLTTCITSGVNDRLKRLADVAIDGSADTYSNSGVRH